MLVEVVLSQMDSPASSKGSAQHDGFSSVEVGHLFSTSACLFKPSGNLLFLRWLFPVRFGWSWITHLKVARNKHTRMHMLCMNTKSVFLLL